TRVGNVLSQRAGLGELFDQPPKRGAMKGVEPALQADPAVTAIPDAQLTSRGTGVIGLGRSWPVRIELVDDAPCDHAQPVRVEVLGVLGQRCLCPVTIVLTVPPSPAAIASLSTF